MLESSGKRFGGRFVDIHQLDSFSVSSSDTANPPSATGHLQTMHFVPDIRRNQQQQVLFLF